MWLNGGYYYRGMLYSSPGELATLSEHLGGPPPPEENPGNELSWQPVFTFFEDAEHKGKTNKYSGEDWPQPIGTWDAIYFCHRADNGEGVVTIPDADDARREKDLCPCMVTQNGGQSPDCTLPNWHRPVRM